MSIDKENVFESVKAIIFTPLNELFQNIDESFSEFVYFNDLFDALVIAHCDTFMFKMMLENSASETGAFEGIKIITYDKKRQAKVDEQVIYFKEKVKIIATNRDKIKSLVTEMDISDSLAIVADYIEQWRVFTNNK